MKTDRSRKKKEMMRIEADSGSISGVSLSAAIDIETNKQKCEQIGFMEVYWKTKTLNASATRKGKNQTEVEKKKKKNDEVKKKEKAERERK